MSGAGRNGGAALVGKASPVAVPVTMRYERAQSAAPGAQVRASKGCGFGLVRLGLVLKRPRVVRSIVPKGKL